MKRRKAKKGFCIAMQRTQSVARPDLIGDPMAASANSRHDHAAGLQTGEGWASDKATSDLEAARDFREQQQARFSNIDPASYRESVKTNFNLAWHHAKNVFPDAEFEDPPQDYHQAVETSHDDPLSHAGIKHTKELVEKAARRIGLPLHGGVSAGALHSAGIEAMQQRVLLADSSVILINANLIMTVNRFAKLLALTTPIVDAGGGKFRVSERFVEYAAQLAADENLRTAWRSFFLDHAISSAQPPRGDLLCVPGRERPTLTAQLQDAMMTFVVAHEYAHHIAKHGLNDVASAEGPVKEMQHEQELDADMIGAHLCMSVAADEDELNFFCFANVGAVLVLTLLERVRTATDVLTTGDIHSHAPRDSHPPLSLRLAAILQVSAELLQPDQHAIVSRAQSLFIELLQLVWTDALQFHRTQFASGVRAQPETTQWLPR